jgi:hypothetical protein
VQLMLRFPKLEELPAWRLGAFAWRWTAAFEAYSSDVEQADASGTPRRQTPAGTYRFVVDGQHRPAPGAAARPYRLESRSFTVSRWDGLTAEDVRIEPDGTVSFAPGPVRTHTFGTDRIYTVGPVDYPDAYDSPFRFLDGERRLFTYGLADAARHQQYCPRCTFKPWADTGELESATVTVRKPGGGTRTLRARPEAGTGRWRTTGTLEAGEAALVAPGGLVDAFGETNGAPSATVTR